MRFIKKKFIVWLFLTEIVIFFGNFFISKNGLSAITCLEKESKKLLHEINAIKGEIAFLEKEIHNWTSYPFYKEKVAREQLHMSKQNEMIYYLY